MATRLFSFAGGEQGVWRVERVVAICGETLPQVSRFSMLEGDAGSDAIWRLRGITSNERYVERAEKDALVAKQEGLGRQQASCAALIPIRKSAAWWALTQDERRAIFEAKSEHIQIGMRYLPAIARRLHHCRDLGENEPFDFLTWFEFAPADASAFDKMLAALRATPEWGFVEREVEVRLVME